MKVMHLSDLHLGKIVLEQSMIEDQRYILKQIINISKEKTVDIVLISGDIYDKVVPNVEAVRLFSDFLTRLYQLKVKVFVISGNHDSKDRLSFGNELFVDNGVYIEGIFSGNLRCVTLEDEYGELHIYMLPFVKPIDVKKYFPECKIESYQDAVRVILECSSIDKKSRNIIMIHQFVTAGGVDLVRSDSETISLGGIDNIDVSLFDDFDYVAMGHVHGAQKLLRETVRYAGSPLKYSFSEVHQRKSISIIEFQEKGNVQVELVELAPIRDMRVIKGPIEKLLDKEIINQGNVDDYISAIITDSDYVMDAIGKLRSVYKNVLKLEYQNERTMNVSSGKNCASGDVSKKSVLDLFSEFYENQNHIKLDYERRKILMDIIYELKEKE